MERIKEAVELYLEAERNFLVSPLIKAASLLYLTFVSYNSYFRKGHRGFYSFICLYVTGF